MDITSLVLQTADTLGQQVELTLSEQCPRGTDIMIVPDGHDLTKAFRASVERWTPWGTVEVNYVTKRGTPCLLAYSTSKAMSISAYEKAVAALTAETA